MPESIAKRKKIKKKGMRLKRKGRKGRLDVWEGGGGECVNKEDEEGTGQPHFGKGSRNCTLLGRQRGWMENVQNKEDEEEEEEEWGKKVQRRRAAPKKCCCCQQQRQRVGASAPKCSRRRRAIGKPNHKMAQT
jgi:hypothetical protein